jgi:hypothetical protein
MQTGAGGWRAGAVALGQEEQGLVCVCVGGGCRHAGARCSGGERWVRQGQQQQACRRQPLLIAMLLLYVSQRLLLTAGLAQSAGLWTCSGAGSRILAQNPVDHAGCRMLGRQGFRGVSGGTGTGWVGTGAGGGGQEFGACSSYGPSFVCWA